MNNCQFIHCEEKATTKGFVLTLNHKEPGKDIPVEVYACETHKNHSSFFEYVKRSESL